MKWEISIFSGIGTGVFQTLVGGSLIMTLNWPVDRLISSLFPILSPCRTQPTIELLIKAMFVLTIPRRLSTRHFMAQKNFMFMIRLKDELTASIRLRAKMTEKLRYFYYRLIKKLARARFKSSKDVKGKHLLQNKSPVLS